MRTLLAATLLVVLAPPAAGQGTFEARVHRILDGDTYHVLRATGEIVVVRLWGVDAPEAGQPYGAAATRRVQRSIGGKRIRVTVEDTDRYGRFVSRVEVEGKSLGHMLVREGLAWHDDRSTPRARVLARLERQARAADRGLWSRPNPIPPWIWRRRSSGTLPPAPGVPERLRNASTPHG